MEDFNYPEALGITTALAEMLLEQLDECHITNATVEFARQQLAEHKARFAEHSAQVRSL